MGGGEQKREANSNLNSNIQVEVQLTTSYSILFFSFPLNNKTTLEILLYYTCMCAHVFYTISVINK